MLEQFAIPWDEYESRHEEANDRWEKGELSDDAFLKQTVFFKTRSFTPCEFIQAVRAQSKWLPGGAKNVIAALRRKDGLKMAMLNNESGPSERFSYRELWAGAVLRWIFLLGIHWDAQAGARASSCGRGDAALQAGGVRVCG